MKNDTFQFPDKSIPVHPDFRLIMTANTLHDYSDAYNGRNPLDQATLSRCEIIHYDMKDYHMALRYGFNIIKNIDLTNKNPREIEREVIKYKIQNNIK